MMHHSRNYDHVGILRCHKETIYQLKKLLNGVPASRWVRFKVEEELEKNNMNHEKLLH
tara:strand:+ start:730 stop:903 length:174 start_codon:yes stop_codon:yes gene_type:complete